jgi:L-threonylcarbamoyladenylate synthase
VNLIMKMIGKTSIGTDLEVAKALLLQGQPVAIPTETVYGLAANALDPDAVLKIFKAKNRPHFNPLIIHLPDWKSILNYVQNVPPEAEMLAKVFSPGPITFLLERIPPNPQSFCHSRREPNPQSIIPHPSFLIPDLVTAGSPKVAVRIPAHPLTQQLLQMVGVPLAAPSANPFGYVSPTTAAHVLHGLNGKIPYVLDGGPCQIGLESTIVDFDNQQVIIRRQGGVAVEAIEATLGKQVLVQTGVETHPVAPGQLKSHYATSTPLFILEGDNLPKGYSPMSGCVIAFGNNMDNIAAKYRFQLSVNADMDEAAKQLFATMREADNCGATMILVKRLPEIALGIAMNDRLKRASFQP